MLKGVNNNCRFFRDSLPPWRVSFGDDLLDLFLDTGKYKRFPVRPENPMCIYKFCNPCRLPFVV